MSMRQYYHYLPNFSRLFSFFRLVGGHRQLIEALHREGKPGVRGRGGGRQDGGGVGPEDGGGVGPVLGGGVRLACGGGVGREGWRAVALGLGWALSD